MCVGMFHPFRKIKLNTLNFYFEKNLKIWCIYIYLILPQGDSSLIPHESFRIQQTDPVIPLLGIYPEKTIIQKESCTTTFIADLFTIARTWKQPKCPSTDEWTKKKW